MRTSIAILLMLFLATPSSAEAAPAAGGGSRTGFEIFAAVGPLLSPSSLRFGGSEWEGGLLSPEILGFDKVLRFNQFYSAFGFGFMVAPKDAIGFYGAAGFETDMFWGMFLRGELSAAASPSGQAGATALLGICVFL